MSSSQDQEGVTNTAATPSGAEVGNGVSDSTPNTMPGASSEALAMRVDDAYAEHEEEEDHSAYGDQSYSNYTAAQQDPSAVDMDAYPDDADTQHEQRQDAAYEAAERGDHDDPEGDDGDEMEDGQVLTDYHGSADRAEAHNRRLQQKKMYDDIPAPPEDADPHTVFAYYRKMVGLVQLVPPKHWREIRFDLPANVAELRLYPQRRERIQDREPVRPSSTVVINLDGTLPENTTPTEYAAQMVQYFFDLLQYQNATSAVTSLRFVKRGTELSQMVVTLGRDARLAGRVLTELQAAGLRAHYGMIIFEHPPSATFQVVDYRRTLHDGKGISAEDIAFLLEPMRQTKTVDINVIEGFEPGVFYVPVKRPEAVYAFLWNYFCSYKFQSDLFRRYGVLVTQANCPHEFLKKGIPYHVQKRELEEKIKAELLRKGLEEREGGMDGAGHREEDDGVDSELDEEAVARGEGPPPAWANAAADEIDIFGGLTKPLVSADANSATNIANPNTHNIAALTSLLASKVAGTDTQDASKAPIPGAAANSMNAAASALAFDTATMAEFDALTMKYGSAPEPAKSAKGVRGAKASSAPGGPTTQLLPPPPPPPPMPAGAPPFLMGGEGRGGYGWVDPRQQQQQLPPPPSPQPSGRDAMYPGSNAYPGDYVGSNNSGNRVGGGYPPYPGAPTPYSAYPLSSSLPPPPPPPMPHAHAGPGGYGGYPTPGGPAPFANFVTDSAPLAANPVDYPPLVEDEDEDEEENNNNNNNMSDSGSSNVNDRVFSAQQQQGGYKAARAGAEAPSGYGVQQAGSPTSGGYAPPQRHNGLTSLPTSSPFEKEGLLSWSMEDASPATLPQSSANVRGLATGSSHINNNNVAWGEERQEHWADDYHGDLLEEDDADANNPYASSSPAPGEEGKDAAGAAAHYPGNEPQIDANAGASGGGGILGDYDPSLDAPFYDADSNTNNSGEGYAQQQQQAEWGMQNPSMMMAGAGSASYADDVGYGYGYGYGQGWQQDGGQDFNGAYDGAYSVELQQQQQSMLYMPPPPHVVEAAQITVDLEERIAAAFPASWAATPLPLDGEWEMDELDAAAARSASSTGCILQHIPVEVAAREVPPPNTEMEELFQFLHRNVSLIGRLLHKTTTTTVAQANDVAPYRARVARALLIGVATTAAPTSSTTTTTTTAEACDALGEACAAAWRLQRADGQTEGTAHQSGMEERHQSSSGAADPVQPIELDTKKDNDDEAGQNTGSEATQARDVNTDNNDSASVDKEADDEEAAEEEEVEYQLPALLPYLLRMPAGVDLAFLLALHYPRAFAHRFLPYAAASLFDENIVHVVLSTVLRRDPRSEALLVRALLAHWCPLLQWLKAFVNVKASSQADADNSHENQSSTSSRGDGAAVAARTTNPTVVKQLVSLLGNTMDAVLAGLSPDQRDACYSCSTAHNYVKMFTDGLVRDSTTAATKSANDGSSSAESAPAPLWGLDGALYRSLLRLYLGADVCDGATLARHVLSSHTSDAPESTTPDHGAESVSAASPALRVCITRDRFYYTLAVLTRSQTAPALSREAAAFCGTVLQLIEAQQTQSGSEGVAVAEGEARQLLENALKSLQTTEAYAALREAYLNASGPITRFECVQTVLNSVEPPAGTTLHGPTYRDWYVNTQQAQKRNAEAAKVPSVFYYQPPSRRINNNTVSGALMNNNNNNNNFNSTGVVNGQQGWAQPQQPVWASADAQWASNGSNNGSGNSGVGVLGQRGQAVSTAAQQWRFEWTEAMRTYPASGTPFEGTLPEGWSSSLVRSCGLYSFTKKQQEQPTSGEEATTTTTEAETEAEDKASASAATTATTAAAAPAPSAAPTFKHPVDGKEYMVTPQAFLQEPGATATVTAMQVCERANAMHRDEAAASGLPPPAALTQADVETWLADQRRRNVFLDIATMELLEVHYRNNNSNNRSNNGSNGPSGRSTPAAVLAGAKRHREGFVPVGPTPRQPLSPEELQTQLRQLIPDSYPAVGAPYPALFHSWSVYYNSARGQYGFSGPHHNPSHPPLFVHPSTKKHYFISPQNFVRQRKVNYDVIARAAEVDKAEVESWMKDQRTRHIAIDAAVVKIVPIHYADVEKALADNAAAAAAASEKDKDRDKKTEGSGGNESSTVTTARERERAAAAPGGQAANASSASSGPANTRHRADKGREGNRNSNNNNNSSSSRRQDRRGSSGSRDRHNRRRRRDDSFSDDGDDSYSDDDDDDNGDYARGGGRRRRGNRRGRSPRRRGGGGGSRGRGGGGGGGRRRR